MEHILDKIGLTYFWGKIKSLLATGLSGKADKATTLSGYGITDAINTSSTAQTKAGNLTAAKFITKNGTSSQFVKGDGSLSSTVPMDKVSWVRAGHEELASIENLYYNVGLNVLAFLNPEYITAEYTTNGGTTWLDYEASNDAKIALFTTSGLLAVGKKTGSKTRTNNDAVRVTISAGCGTYCHSEFIIIRYYGSGGVSIKVEYTTYADATTFVEHTTLTNLSSNPGNIIIPFDKYLFGNKGVHDLRLTMTYTGSNYPTLSKSLCMIRVYSNNVYGTPSNLAASGHLYSFDASQNATFPAKITSTGFIKSGGTSSQFLKADGSVDETSYGTYSKPSGGIPKTDLDSAVQTSLGKADTALQSFTETDPTVPAWAKAANKPSYTAAEVGALPDSTTIPTKVSDLTNDSGFTSNTGTITGITMNGASKGTSGVVNLGTVITEHQSLAGKQDVISDLATIRSGASAGATAYQKPSTGIPKTDLASAVQTSLGKADTALQSHQDISGKADVAALAGYTPTANFATINGASITGGGDIQILAAEGQTITIDATPTSGSSNPVQSGGVYDAIEGGFYY